MRPLRMTTSNAAMPASSKRAIPTDRFGGGITFPPTEVAEMDSHREASMERMRAVVPARAEVVEQRDQLGTGHAVLQALPLIETSSDPVLVLYGDTPLLEAATSTALVG